MKKNTKIVDPNTYPEYGDVDYNTKPKKACNKSCDKQDDNNIELQINWGWQVDGILLAIAANFLLGVATIITIFIRK